MDSKRDRIHSIMSEAAAKFHKEGAPFLIAASNPSKERMRIRGDIKGGGLFSILDAILTTKEDAIALGVFAGNLIATRREQEGANKTTTV